MFRLNVVHEWLCTLRGWGFGVFESHITRNGRKVLKGRDGAWTGGERAGTMPLFRLTLEPKLVSARGPAHS